MYQRPLAVFVSSVAVCLAIAACSRSSPPQMQPASVTVVTLKAEAVTLTRELSGRVTSSLVAEVRPQITGIVQRRLFTEGGVVRAGEALYQIDDAPYRADADSARATLARADATLEAARLKANRFSELAKKGVVSAQDNESAIATLRQAEADVGIARAALERSNVALGHTRIKAPISGRIGKSSVTQGALVTANQDSALATVQQLDPIYIDVAQAGSELLQLRKQLAAGTLNGVKALPVTIKLEDGSQYAHAGKLAFSEVSIDQSTGSYSLRVIAPNPDGMLLPGMYVRALVGEGVRQGGVLAPQQGIARTPKGGASAMVVGKDGRVEFRSVTVSQAIGDKWLVEEGLAAGDRVIVEGLQKIQPGMSVRVTEAGTATVPASPTTAK